MGLDGLHMLVFSRVSLYRVIQRLVIESVLQLYNVVVDTEETGKQLLQKGGLRRRYTIIPLNKISSHSIPDNTTRKAQSLVRLCVCTVLPGFLQ